MTAPVEPTLDDIVAMAADLHYHEAICARTAVDLVADLVPIWRGRAALLLAAAEHDLVTRIQTIHIDDDWRPVASGRGNTCSICGAPFIGGHCPICGWF